MINLLTCNLNFIRKLCLVFLIVAFLAVESFGQKGEKLTRYFGEPILTDSLSTVFFPARYNQDVFSSDKVTVWGDYYANIVVYDFKTDTYRKLFETDTYIEAFKRTTNHRYGYENQDKFTNITRKWVFMVVLYKDYNNSGKINSSDPSVLFITTTRGENLKPLTDGTESVVSLEIYESQGFGLVKFQRDSNNDKSFNGADKDFYYKKISLNDLSFGKEIEVK